MVRALIIVNCGVFVVTNVLGSLPFQSAALYLRAYPSVLFGLVPYAVTHELHIWQLVTYLFLHGGFFHILFNMFALWMFGSDLERLWGEKQFLVYYFLTGIGAGVCDVLLRPSSTIPTIGCSGAVFGLILAYGMLFPDRVILLSLIIPIKAKWFALLYGAIEFVNSYSDSASGVSHVAHLGGMLFGYLYLRGGHLPAGVQLRYRDWKRARLRRKFEVYMRKQERKDDHGRWIN